MKNGLYSVHIQMGDGRADGRRECGGRTVKSGNHKKVFEANGHLVTLFVREVY